MMKEGGVSHQGNEFHPYANGNMQHMYNNSRQTPDSGLGNEELRNSMNNAGGGGDNSGAAAPGGAPPGFQPNPYYVGNAQQSQYNDQQQQQQFRHKPYSGGQQEGGRFDRSSGPPSIVTMHTSPPNMDQDVAPSYNPNYNYSQYSNQGGQPYGGMDRNYNAPHPMAARSHSNYSESSSSTLNMAAGGPPDPSLLSGQPLMAPGPHGGMMYPQQGGQMGPPYGHPQMQQQHMQQGGGGPFMYNPAAHAAAMATQQMMQSGQMGQQQGVPPGMHPQGIPMQPPQGSGPMPPGPPQSTSPPHPGMMMVPMGQHGGPPMHPNQTVYYPQHPAMMSQRGPVVASGPEGFVQFTYSHSHPGGAPPQPQGGFPPMRGPLMQHQRSLNSPAPSDNTDGQSVHGGAPSIGMWNGPPDQQSQQSSPPGGLQPMQPGMMVMQPHPMMGASYPGATGLPFGNTAPGGPRMVPTPMGPLPPYSVQQMQQMALQHAMMQSQGVSQMHPQQFPAGGGGGFPQQAPQPQSGYWQGPNQGGGRGGFRGSRGGRGGGGGYGGNRPNSRQYTSRNNSIASGGRGREVEESSKCTTPTEDDIVGDVSHQMDSMRMGDESMEGGHNPSTVPHKQLLQLADTKSSSPPAEPRPSEDECVVVQKEGREEGGNVAPIPTTPRTEPRKEMLEMKKTPKHQTDKGSSQSIPVDPVPPHGTTTAAPSTTRTWSQVARPSCVYCKGMLSCPEEEYTTHNVRGANGEVTCPRLREIGCDFCGTKGDQAHDAFFCPERLVDIVGEVQNAPMNAPRETHATHTTHSTHGDREGGYRGGAKRRGGAGGAGGGGHYNNRGRGAGGGGYGGDRKYDNRRVQ